MRNNSIKKTILILVVLLVALSAEAHVFGESGGQIRFTVYYQDADGKALIEPHMFYDSEGSKTEIRYVEIAGYEPVVTRLTKTLSSNDDENVFTFVYRKTEESAEDKNTAEESSTPGNQTLTDENVPLAASEVKYDLDVKPPIAEPGEPMSVREERSFSFILLIITCIIFVVLFSRLRHKAKQ